jgi:signal transduction histidine kinase
VSGKRTFKVDARVLLSLGRESIKDNTTALVELIKNAYDADAQRVDIEVQSEPVSTPSDFIRIADNGHGMTTNDIDTKWLRIGYSEKRTKTISEKGRRETGEKGIGRLSADRLGAVLELRSKQDAHPAVGISVNWNQFDQDGTDISAVDVEALKSPSPTLPPTTHRHKSTSGTEIVIRQLRQSWTPEDLNRLEHELSSLIAPSDVADEFQIWLKRPKAKMERLASSMDMSAELAMDASFDAKGRLTYTITEKPKNKGGKRHTSKTGKVNWNEIASNNALSDYSLGRIRVALSFHLRVAANLSDGLTLSQLRDYLDRNAGVRIYRDGVRVKPYGDLDHPEGDWLGMSARKTSNPAGAGRKSFRFAANQIVGSVYIGRDTNKSLLDSAAREGLVQGQAYALLKNAVYYCISLLESAYHTAFTEAKPPAPSDTESLPSVVTTMKSTLESLSKDLSAQGEPHKVLAQSAAKLRLVTETFQRAQRKIEELANESVIYRGLATVGISSAVFGHETESALAQAKLSSSVVLEELAASQPDLDMCLDEMHAAEEAIARVDLWGQFALNRIRRDKRRRAEINLSELLSGLAVELRPLFEAKKIKLTTKISSDLKLRGFAMDLESIALNLLTNAYHAAGLKSKNREVHLSLSRIGNPPPGFLKLTVSDSGNGIAKENLAQIWTPLFSTKSDEKGNLVGTGLGLSIVQSVTRDIEATVRTVGKGPLGGATIEVLIPAPVIGGR